jgi:hypothetical protein
MTRRIGAELRMVTTADEWQAARDHEAERRAKA